MLATKVLASGITHLTDARYFASWEVDYLAFPLGDGVTEAISWDYLNALREWVEGPEIVAEIGRVDDGTAWTEILATHNIKTVLLYEDTADEVAETMKAAGITVIRQLMIDQFQTGEDVQATIAEHPTTDLFILGLEDWVTYQDVAEGAILSIEALDQISRTHQCLLQLNLGGEDPKAIKDRHPIAGFAVRGSSEEKVGYKSFDDIDDLFEGLEVFE
jgi:phosphoribosylanthranilate isomerase